MEAIRELTLHIGLPKTATTVLRGSVFPQIPGYLGKYSGLPPTNRFVNPTTGSLLEGWERGNPDWRGAIDEWVRSLAELDERHLLLSQERLASWPARLSEQRQYPFDDDWFDAQRVRPHPVVDFLDLVKTAGESSGIKVRVIVTLRAQPEFMASRYAQSQGKMRQPGQGDFEAKVRESLRRADPYFDYASLVEELAGVVGMENLLVLLYEDGVEINVERISLFVDLPLRFAHKTRENVKRRSPRTWEGPPTYVPVTQRGVLGNIRKVARSSWPDALRVLEAPLKRIVTGLDVAAARLVEPKRFDGVQVELSGELSDEIRRRYGSSNDRLARILGRDLEQLGY